MANRTDNFNRTDSIVTLDSPSDAGGNYTIGAGTWGITSNEGYVVVAANPSAAVLDSATSDVTVEVTIATLGAGDIGGLCARYSDINNHWMWYLDAANNKTRLYKMDTGSFVQLIDDAGAPASGDTLKLTFSGNNWTAYRNGSSVGSGSDAFNNTATKHGLWAYSVSTSTRWDTFSITDAGAGGSAIPVLMVSHRQHRRYRQRPSGVWAPSSFVASSDITRSACAI